jgi:hypothetical protein
MAKAQPAGTVTVLERSKGGLAVVVVRDMIHVNWYPVPIADRYRITTNTGFRAEFRACYADRCLDGTITPCTCDGQGSRSVNAWLAHSRITCHGWHDAKAVAFARKVLGSTTPDRERSVGARSGYYRPRDFAPCAWPVERQGRLVTFTDGRPRPVDYGYDINTPIIAPGTEPTS